MKERPILFSAPMVRAILAGTKTQTRRTVKPQPDIVAEGGTVVGIHTPDDERHGRLGKILPCPYGQSGDRLWVREAWRSGKLTDRFPPREMTPHVVWYEADGQAPEACSGKLRPAMFMPRWASRITLEVVEVRVERLQDISEADAKAEGAPEHVSPAAFLDGHRQGFRLLWLSINGPGSWDANPWVWVLEFKRVTP